MWRLVAVGVLVHLVMLAAVFEVYFKSPLEHGMQHHRAEAKPSRRVVLLVADGLRAESLYGPKMLGQAPYLRNIMNKVGSWGISHTQVPTESRPGHIAMLAGFNEDPSAIFKGWKSNPVDFDSVINQSANTWCWGSPDILNIFKSDIHPRHVTLDSYDAYMQDFSGQKSPAVLDTWVFKRVQNFFEDMQKGYCGDVSAQGNLFFLHLLGLDTAGHSFKPGSKEHIENIKVVDEGIELVEALFNNYFRDNLTTYIFTSDHGMTDWGSHGDGSTHETEVPFIAWGAGIRTNSMQQDIDQTDIAPFISALLGRSFPINSFGVVPLGYINASRHWESLIIYANAQQLAEIYLRKLRNIESSSVWHQIRYFAKLPEKVLVYKLESINDFINRGFYEIATNLSYNVINLCKEGVHYYNNYYQQVLLSIVAFGFIGWIVYLFISIENLGTFTYRNCVRRANIRSDRLDLHYLPYALYITLFGIGVLLYVEEVSMKYYYFMFPILTWFAVLWNYKKGLIMLAVLETYSPVDLIFRVLSLFAGIEILLLSFFNRTYLSGLFLYLGFVIMKYEPATRTSLLFAAGHIFLGLGPLVLTLQTEFDMFVHIVTLLCWLLYTKILFTNITSSLDKRLLGLQMCMLFAAFSNTLIVSVMLKKGAGLLWNHKVLSWILTLASPLVPIFNSFSRIELKITSALMALMTPYSLMAVGFESFYMFLFAQHMLNWLVIEMENRYHNAHERLHVLNNYMDGDGSFTDENSIRHCFYLLSFIMLSYFGVGNTSSINSFDPMWVRCFVTVFSPFTMMGLIILKILIPFQMVMCAFRAVMIQTKAQIRNNFLIILLFCDCILIQLLYMVTNQGSWLEIGLSLSRFIVVSVTSIALLVLYEIAYFFTEREVSGIRSSWNYFRQFNP